MTFSTECVVIGAGVVGLAVARALALAGREVIVLEKERWIGSETSSRNSEVIHAGLYYPEGSLKARLCREGRDRRNRPRADRALGGRAAPSGCPRDSSARRGSPRCCARRSRTRSSALSRGSAPRGPRPRA